MQARDVMTERVVSIHPDTTVKAISELLLKYEISAVPVLDLADQLVGLVSEGDLMRRLENQDDRRRPWWLEVFSGTSSATADFLKANGRRAEDIMTRNVVTIAPDTPLHEIATTLETRRIKRVPVLEDGRVVGIVSRANLLHGIASDQEMPAPSDDDRFLRIKVVTALRTIPGIDPTLLNVTVKEGIVDIWGIANSDDEDHAIKVAADQVPGVRDIRLRVGRIPTWAWGLY